MSESKSEIRDGMWIDWDVPIPMDDGVLLRCDVFRPIEKGQYPAILAYGPYGKWLHFQDGFPSQWKVMEEVPEIMAGSSNKYQNFEVVDPEKWVPDGYACVRVDSRGAGRSPDYMEVWSPRETKDLYDCIEWAAGQPWCNGKVGLNGISYLAMNQWWVASLQPPHLSAMCVWEGAADLYRDLAFHGGILSLFSDGWYRNTITRVQHGRGRRGFRSRVNGDWVSGPETLADEELGANRSDYPKDVASHPLFDKYWKARMPDYSKIDVPVLSAANWGGQGLHPRGNTEGFLNTASDRKWLEFHGLTHFTHFYSDYGVALQKRFFNCFLRGETAGWDKQPRVSLNVRHPGEKFVLRGENEWPLARTRWTKFYLDASAHTLTAEPQAEDGDAVYESFGEGLTFLTPPLREETEITGPAAAKLFVSSETEDADIFLVLRVFSPEMRELTFQGSNDPHTPIGLGWLRASHRKLDAERTLPYRPFHVHEERQPLTPGEVYELDVEIWPTCIVVPAGWRVGLSVRGKDYVWPGDLPVPPPPLQNPRFAPGVGPFRHSDPHDRPAAVFGGRVTLHMGPSRQAHLLLPIIPPK